MTDIPKNPIYTDDEAARPIWSGCAGRRVSYASTVAPSGTTLPRLRTPTSAASQPSPGKRHKPAREGLYYCNECEGTFSVTVGTVMEDSHVPLHKWLYAFRVFLCLQERHQRSPDASHNWRVSYKTAWFIGHRIREALRQGGLAPPMMGGSQSKVVEADETFIGKKADVPKQRGYAHKHAVLTLIDRTSGEARSFHVDEANAANIVPIVRANVAKETTIATDEASHYNSLNREYYHATVNHSAEEWAVGEFHTNSAEGYFSLFKRSVRGTYSHISEKHLHRYLAEFDFRYSNRVKLGVDDTKRTERALRGIEGKRLTYRRTRGARPQPDEAPF